MTTTIRCEGCGAPAAYRERKHGYPRCERCAAWLGHVELGEATVAVDVLLEAIERAGRYLPGETIRGLVESCLSGGAPEAIAAVEPLREGEPRGAESWRRLYEPLPS